MERGLVAKATIVINAPVSKVWDALVNPEIIKKYFFGTTVVSNWSVGSSIIWKGEWQGKPYEDKGQILELKPEELLVVTHYSPLSGVPDVPENYHTLSYELESSKEKTTVTLTQDNNATEEERKHSKENWEMILISLKKLLDK